MPSRPGSEISHDDRRCQTTLTIPGHCGDWEQEKPGVWHDWYRCLDVVCAQRDAAVRELVEMKIKDGWKDYGDLSAVEPPYRRRMYCDACSVTWLGCWDNFQCPECGKGELPEPPENMRGLK